MGSAPTSSENRPYSSPSFVHTYGFDPLPTYLRLPTDLPSYLPAYLLTCNLATCLPSTPTYLPTYLCLPTYLPARRPCTYIHM